MSDSPVVCHINLAKGFRGGERQTQLLVRELAVLGWQQRLVVRKNSALPATVDKVAGLEICEVASNAISASVQTRGCQLVHAHEARALYAGLIGNLRYGIPYIGTRRVTNPFNISPARDWAYRKAAKIAVLSRSIAGLVERRYPDSSTVIIPSAHADLAHDHHRESSFIAPYQGKTVIGHVGALVRPHKGQHNIIEVAHNWQHKYPHVLFLLVGSGKDEAEFRELATGLTNVGFAGQVTNVDDYLDLFDIFVFPSLMEGLGSTLLDAMCFGLPIVASDVGGIPDIIENGVNGLLVGADDADALGVALEKVLNDPALQDSMRQANLQKSRSYTAAAMTASYDALYRELLHL